MVIKKKLIGNGIPSITGISINQTSYSLSIPYFSNTLHPNFIFSISNCLFGKRKRTTKWNLSESYFPFVYGRDSGNVVSCGVREGVKAGYSKTTRHFVSPSQMHYLQDDVEKNFLDYKPN